MTKLSSEFCFMIDNKSNPEKTFWLGMFLFPIMISIENNEKGLEIMKSTSKYYPEIIILHE